MTIQSKSRNRPNGRMLVLASVVFAGLSGLVKAGLSTSCSAGYYLKLGSDGASLLAREGVCVSCDRGKNHQLL